MRDVGGQQVQDGCVDDTPVAGVVQQEDLASVTDLVEVGGGQMTAQGPLVVAGDAHPVAGRTGAGDGFRDDREYVVDPGAAGDARGVLLEPGPGEVHMGVDEPGEHGGALQVDHLAGGQGGHGLVEARDPALPDAHVMGDRVVRVHGEETGVRQPGAQHR